MRKPKAPKKAAAPIRAVVAVSDLHVWSTVGLWPEGDFKNLAGCRVGQNDFQKWLWDCWINLWTKEIPRALGNEPFLLLINGDIVEGRHHRTDQVMSGSEDDQMEAFEAVMKPLAGMAAKTIVVKGTECHTRNLENIAAKLIGAIPDPNSGHGAWDKAVFDISDTRCVARHHISSSARVWTETAGPRAALLSEQLEALKNGEPVPKVVLAAHRHVYGEDRSMNGLSVVTPAWQALTRHGYKVVPQSHGCNPGAVVLTWEDGDLPESELIVYRSDPIKAVKL